MIPVRMTMKTNSFPKINYAVWRSRVTLIAGYLFAVAAALQNGVAGIPPLLPMVPPGIREKLAAGVAVILTLQAIQTRVQKPSGIVRTAEVRPAVEPNAESNLE